MNFEKTNINKMPHCERCGQVLASAEAICEPCDQALELQESMMLLPGEELKANPRVGRYVCPHCSSRFNQAASQWLPRRWYLPTKELLSCPHCHGALKDREQQASGWVLLSIPLFFVLKPWIATAIAWLKSHLPVGWHLFIPWVLLLLGLCVWMLIGEALFKRGRLPQQRYGWASRASGRSAAQSASQTE